MREKKKKKKKQIGDHEVLSSTIRDVWAQHTRTMQSYSVNNAKVVVCVAQMVSAQDGSDWAMMEEHPYPDPPSTPDTTWWIVLGELVPLVEVV
jgi:hypothetical protein